MPGIEERVDEKSLKGAPFFPQYSHRGTSVIKKIHPPRITIEPKARGYCRVLRGDVSYERGTPVDSSGTHALPGSFCTGELPDRDTLWYKSILE